MSNVFSSLLSPLSSPGALVDGQLSLQEVHAKDGGNLQQREGLLAYISSRQSGPGALTGRHMLAKDRERATKEMLHDTSEARLIHFGKPSVANELMHLTA